MRGSEPHACFVPPATTPDASYHLLRLSCFKRHVVMLSLFSDDATRTVYHDQLQTESLYQTGFSMIILHKWHGMHTAVSTLFLFCSSNLTSCFHSEKLPLGVDRSPWLCHMTRCHSCFYVRRLIGATFKSSPLQRLSPH